MSTFEEFIDKLGPYPNDVNRLTRLIRLLDKRLENIQATLVSQQKRFELKLKDLKDKRVTEVPQDIRAEYDNIVAKQKEMYGYAKEKEQVASQLLDVIASSYEMVKTDLKTKLKEKPSEDQKVSQTKKQKKPVVEMGNKQGVKNDQFLYDNANPKYCYCVGGSYGEMIGCESTFCEKEWFHMECVDDKSALSEAAWHCKDCKKLL